mmetsp:Transcript_5882/g.9335  ORF Transcript_5882/g.9335 Transcript_5882/m.9335 type:complete len:225 (+) Transcript_5882:1246-1920(+)
MPSLATGGITGAVAAAALAGTDQDLVKETLEEIRDHKNDPGGDTMSRASNSQSQSLQHGTNGMSTAAAAGRQMSPMVMASPYVTGQSRSQSRQQTPSVSGSQQNGYHSRGLSPMQPAVPAHPMSPGPPNVFPVHRSLSPAQSQPMRSPLQQSLSPPLGVSHQFAPQPMSPLLAPGSSNPVILQGPLDLQAGPDAGWQPFGTQRMVFHNTSQTSSTPGSLNNTRG